MAKFKVYCNANQANGKIYVGQTVQELGRYLRSSVTNAALGRTNKPHLYSAIRKWGSKNFDIQLILTAPDKESADKMKRQLEKLGLNASLITL